MQIHTDSAALRVLLVDDDSIALELLSLLLAGKGTEVLRASGGEEALRALQSLSPLPDVVLVDHQMPGVSGVDVGRHVKSLPQPRPRVIAMSASPLPADELAIFDEFVPKPVDPELLRAIIAGSSSSLTAGLPPSLDFSTVSKLQAIMPPSAIRELYTVYVADTRKRISDMERYSASGDQESVRRCAHALKGSAAMAGVPGIASIAAGLEAGRLPPQDYGTLFHQMRSACDDVEQSMIKTAVTNSAATGEAR
jgi:two-component system sensor histidine kinase/response regulator